MYYRIELTDDLNQQLDSLGVPGVVDTIRASSETSAALLFLDKHFRNVFTDGEPKCVWRGGDDGLWSTGVWLVRPDDLLIKACPE